VERESMESFSTVSNALRTKKIQIFAYFFSNPAYQLPTTVKLMVQPDVGFNTEQLHNRQIKMLLTLIDWFP
jgi:hypothetical protein